jgi:acetyltransferase-like isoleucine patch superfamily enzyme
LFDSHAFKQALQSIFGIRQDRLRNFGILIPYGRNSYGPQPELLGAMPWLLKKAQGSRIGNFCSISHGLRFSFLGKHNYQWVTTYPFYDLYEKWKFDIPPLWHKGIPDIAKIEPTPIIVENDVWIATNVTIKEGVRIGNGAVVAMGSLVIKDVPPYSLVGGNPAKVIKFRFSEKQIEELLKIAWWNWNDEEVVRVLPLLLSQDIDTFIDAAKNR